MRPNRKRDANRLLARGNHDTASLGGEAVAESTASSQAWVALRYGKVVFMTPELSDLLDEWLADHVDGLHAP